MVFEFRLKIPVLVCFPRQRLQERPSRQKEWLEERLGGTD